MPSQSIKGQPKRLALSYIGHSNIRKAVIIVKKRKWLLLLIPAALLLAALLFWLFYLQPRLTLSNAVDDAMSNLARRLSESPVPVAAGAFDEDGKNTTALELTVSDGVRYDMQVQTDMKTNQVSAQGTVWVEDNALDVTAYLDGTFAAVTSGRLLQGGYYGITYDSFSSDVRSFPLISRLIPGQTLSKWDTSVEKLQAYMNRPRQIPRLPDIRLEDIRRLIPGLLVLKSDISSETLTVDGQPLACRRFDYRADGEQAAALLGYLMDTDGLSQGEITASFYLSEKALAAVRCDGRAGGNRVSLSLELGQDAAQGSVSFRYEKTENGENSAFSYEIGERASDGAHTEAITLGAQTISFDYHPETGDMLLKLPEKPSVSLNLAQTEDGLRIRTEDFAALMGIDSRKHFDSTMTIRKGADIVTPDYKNLDEWSFDDLLVLLGSIGGLLGLK